MIENEQILSEIQDLSSSFYHFADEFKTSVSRLSDRIDKIEQHSKNDSERLTSAIEHQQGQINKLKEAVAKLAEDDDAVIWKSKENDMIGIDTAKAYAEFSKCHYTPTEAMRTLNCIGILKRGDNNHYCRKVKVKRKPVRAVVVWLDRLD